MQQSQPGAFCGMRVRYSAQVRANGVQQWAGLWLRVDGPSAEQPLAFDNMHDRPIRDDSEWTSYAVVLDVPADATALAYGILLHGAGQVWIDGVRIEVVEQSAPTTDSPVENDLASTPVNLDFEQ